MLIREIPVHQNRIQRMLHRLGLQIKPENCRLKLSKSGQLEEQMYLSILDEKGQPTTYEDWQAHLPELLIDCSQWPKGAYYMSIRSGDRKLLKMFEIRKN